MVEPKEIYKFGQVL